jgi:hypothetical protein
MEKLEKSLQRLNPTPQNPGFPPLPNGRSIQLLSLESQSTPPPNFMHPTPSSADSNVIAGDYLS